MTTNDMLNLDEVLGRAKLKVHFQGEEYPLRGMQSLSPEEFGRVMAYGEKFSGLSQDQIQMDGGKVIIKALEEVLGIIAPEMPRYKPTLRERLKRDRYQRRFALSLQECISVLEFWSQNNRVKTTKNPSRAVYTDKKTRQ